MNNKTHVLVIFGGLSDEHKVSVVSASNIIQFFNPEKYTINLLYIKKNREWILCDKTKFKTNCDIADEIISTIKGKPVFLKIGDTHKARLVEIESQQSISFDVVFSVLHGINGAGGKMQGFWDVASVPHTGPSLISAAIGFDKDVMKRLLKEAGIPICKYKTFSRNDLSGISLDEIKRIFGAPFFIKPANSGSSLGVHKIYENSDFTKAVEDVFRYDEKLIVEEFVDGSELEIYCLRVGNDVKTTIVRQTIVGAEYDFYTYEAKYGKDNANANIKNIPAKIPDAAHEEAKRLSVQSYNVLEGRGLARMDLFYTKEGRILINEINTVPSFMSSVSQPSLWERSGVSHEELVDMMIAGAFQNF